MKKPIILLAFANDHPDNAGYLRDLPKEMGQLQKIVEQAAEKGLCELVIRPNIDVKTLLGTIRKYRQQLTLLLYSGHATSFELLLRESDELQSIHGEGLVPLLGQLPALKLVFLNGCTTANLAQSLVKEGIPAVIGTYQVVADKIATALSIAFFEEFLAGHPLDLSWRNAISILKTTKKQNEFYNKRGIIKRETTLELPIPWDIFYAQNHLPSIKKWNIGLASNNHLLGLPSLDVKKIVLPNTPYRFLDRYKQEDAPIFFGRNQEIGELYYKIQDTNAPLILFYGQSGVGKSSLLEAGLIPRIEKEQSVHFIRRNAEKGLKDSFLALLKEALVTKSIENSSDLLSLLLKQQKSDKKQLFILDQVEEAYTRPIGEQSGTEELIDFLRFVQPILTNNELQLNLMLIFRKEFLADIKSQVEVCAINATEIFIERLSKTGILEVVNGLTTTTELKAKYQLSIEPDLDIEIADDLLADANSPIAPVLQIILSELWKDQAHLPRQFTKEQYRILKTKGILLDDFFQQQLEKIRLWKTTVKGEIANSGLALDVLNYHTTDFGTSESRDLESLRKQYEHQADVLDGLLKQLSQTYLLTNYQEQVREQATGKNKQIEKSGLAHDTLAPIVQKEIRYSDKPGQRALRILESKSKEYGINEKVYLEEEDLALVESGKNGMRIWTRKEKDLIEKSRLIRAKRQKDKRRNRLFASVAFALILSLGAYSWWSTIQQEKISRSSLLMTQGEVLLNKNPTLALPLMIEANEVYPQKAYQEKLAQVKRNYAFYDSLDLKQGINLTAISPDGKYLAYSNPNSASDAVLYDLKEQKEIKKLDDARNNLNHLVFSPDGAKLAIAGEDRRIYLYQSTGQIINILGQEKEIPDESAIIQIAFSQDGRLLASIHQNKQLKLWQTKDNYQTPLIIDLKDEFYVLSIGKEGINMLDNTPSSLTIGKNKQIFIGFKQGKIQQLNTKGDIQWSTQFQANAILHLDYLDEQLLVSYKDGLSILAVAPSDLQVSVKNNNSVESDRQEFTINKNPKPPIIFRLEQPLKRAKFSFTLNYLLIQKEKHALLFNRQNNEVIERLLGHTTNLVAIHPLEVSKEIYTTSVDGKIFSWDLTTDFPQHKLSWEGDNFFRLLAVTQGGKHFLTSRGSVIQYWSIENLDQPIYVSDIHQKQVLAMRLSSDGKSGVSADQNKIILWGITSNGLEVEGELSIKGRKKVQQLAFDAQNKKVLFSYRRGNDLYLWDGTGKEAIPLKGHKNSISGIQFLPSSNNALSVASDSLAILWDISSGKMINDFAHPEKNLIAVSTDNDNQFFTASAANFYYWDIDKRNYKIFPKLEGANINGIKYFKNQLFLSTTRGIKTVQLQTKDQSVFHVDNYGASNNVVSFSEFSDFLITKNKEGTIYVWTH